MASTQIGSLAQKIKPSTNRMPKLSKKNQKVLKEADSLDVGKNAFRTDASIAARPFIDMIGIPANEDTRCQYKSLKRKYLHLKEESHVLNKELEKTELEVRQLQEQKTALLDELLVLEGLASNPYPPFSPLSPE